MAEPRLDRHDKIHHELFDEDTAQIGSLGDIVERHADNVVFLTPPERSVGGADGGLSDFESEMNLSDPAMNEGMDPDDLYSAEDESQVWKTDQTGTVEGIARGFGTHLPQDLGRDGFQIEEIPDSALGLMGRPVRDGEELDDYDDEDDTNGKFDQHGKLARDSEPGANPATPRSDEPTPDSIHVSTKRPHDADDDLSAVNLIK